MKIDGVLTRKKKKVNYLLSASSALGTKAKSDAGCRVTGRVTSKMVFNWPLKLG